MLADNDVKCNDRTVHDGGKMRGNDITQTDEATCEDNPRVRIE